MTMSPKTAGCTACRRMSLFLRNGLPTSAVPTVGSPIPRRDIIRLHLRLAVFGLMPWTTAPERFTRYRDVASAIGKARRMTMSQDRRLHCLPENVAFPAQRAPNLGCAYGWQPYTSPRHHPSALAACSLRAHAMDDRADKITRYRDIASAIGNIQRGGLDLCFLTLCQASRGPPNELVGYDIRCRTAHRAGNMYRLLLWGATRVWAAALSSCPCLARFSHSASQSPALYQPTRRPCSSVCANAQPLHARLRFLLPIRAQAARSQHPRSHCGACPRTPTLRGSCSLRSHSPRHASHAHAPSGKVCIVY